MLNAPSAVRIFAYALPTDMRKSFDGLHALVTNEFTMDVLSGDYFVFFDRSLDRCKILISRSRYDSHIMEGFNAQQSPDYVKQLIEQLRAKNIALREENATLQQHVELGQQLAATETTLAQAKPN